jgi:hypothetical protein
MELAEHKSRLNALRSERATLDSHLQEIVDNFMPSSQGFTIKSQEGEKRMGVIYDSTGVHAATIFANGMAGVFTNSATPWFAIAPENVELNESRAAKTFMAAVEKLYYAAFAKSNFYGEIRKYYHDYGLLGTPIMYSEPHPRTMFNFMVLHLAENYIALDQYGQPDTNYRLFAMSAKQISEKWKDPGEKVSNSLQENKPDQKYQVCQAVYPRKNRQWWSKDGKNKAWASVYFLTQDLHQLNEGGYNEFPFAIARAEVLTGETYGRSMGMIALPFVKILNRMRADKLVASEKALDPPLMIAKNALINSLSSWPGALNVVNAQAPGSSVFPLPMGNLAYTENEIKEVQGEIRQIFFNDLLSLIEAPNQTATEVLERAQEKMRNMGGVVGPLQSGGFNPIFDRMFQVFKEEGLLPPAPPELRGENLKIDYISPLAKAQKSYDLDAIKKGLAGVANIAQIKPNIWDRVNLEEVAQYILESSGMQARFINADDVVQKLRQVRDEQQQAEEMGNLAAQLPKHVAELGKGIDAQSPLALLMNSSEPEGGTLQ